MWLSGLAAGFFLSVLLVCPSSASAPFDALGRFTGAVDDLSCLGRSSCTGQLFHSAFFPRLTFPDRGGAPGPQLFGRHSLSWQRLLDLPASSSTAYSSCLCFLKLSQRSHLLRELWCRRCPKFFPGPFFDWPAAKSFLTPRSFSDPARSPCYMVLNFRAGFHNFLSFHGKALKSSLSTA